MAKVIHYKRRYIGRRPFYNSGNHHLIERHKALLPTFKDENDDCSKSNIDVGVGVD
jgi:hypothetical protein